MKNTKNEIRLITEKVNMKFGLGAKNHQSRSNRRTIIRKTLNETKRMKRAHKQNRKRKEDENESNI